PPPRSAARRIAASGPDAAAGAVYTAAVGRGQIRPPSPSPPPQWPWASPGGTDAAGTAPAVAMRALALLVALLLVATSVSRAAPEPTRGLTGLTTIAVDVELDASQTPVSPLELTRRIDARLRVLAPALTLDPASVNRLRLTVFVRPYSATALR